MIANASGMILRTMLILVNNEHIQNERRIETNTLYHLKTGESGSAGQLDPDAKIHKTVYATLGNELYGSPLRAHLFGHGDTKCFGEKWEYGCYSLGVPWTSESRPISLYPEQPEVINVTYCLYTRRNRDKCQPLLWTEPVKVGRSLLTPNTQTYFIAHGFIENGDKPWILLMKDRFLARSDVNVVVIDWGQGSGPPYNQAVANIRMVGYITSRLIHRMSFMTGLNPKACHIVGHSLGAHMAGYVGYHLREDFQLSLGRITGMDPAQPHFSNTDALVRLDATDAEFVDVIHTDAIDVVAGGFGMEEPIGHLDFYPNGGNTQPGCEQNIFSFISQEDGLFKGIKKFIGCNHVRAHEFFSESILRGPPPSLPCGFWSVECDSYQQFLNGSCFTCPHSGRGSRSAGGKLCARMGLEADFKKLNPSARPTRLYLMTGSGVPYCRWQYLVTIRLSESNKSSTDNGEVGRLKITVTGDVDTAKDMQLFERETFLAAGSVHQRVVAGANVGTVQSVTLTFEYITSLNPLTWRFLEATKIHIASISIESFGYERLTFCTKDDTLVSGKPVTFDRSQTCKG